MQIASAASERRITKSIKKIRHFNLIELIQSIQFNSIGFDGDWWKLNCISIASSVLQHAHVRLRRRITTYVRIVSELCHNRVIFMSKKFVRNMS